MKGQYRILETKEYDVLLRKTLDDEKDLPSVSFEFEIHHEEGVCGVKNTLMYDTEEERDKVFNEFTSEKAEEFITGLLNMGNTCEPEEEELAARADFDRADARMAERREDDDDN